jgi:hypothetical protein
VRIPKSPKMLRSGGKHGRFLWPILRGMVLIVALCAFVPCVVGPLFGVYGARWLVGTIVFLLASFALLAMAPEPRTLPGIEGEGTARRRTLEWSLVSYCAAIDLALNWICAFLWFSRRYPFFYSRRECNRPGYVVLHRHCTFRRSVSWRKLADSPSSLPIGAVLPGCHCV